MRIVGKAGEKYLCSMSMEELMGFFPGVAGPPAAALKEGEEYAIKDWLDRVYRLELAILTGVQYTAVMQSSLDEIRKAFTDMRGKI